MFNLWKFNSEKNLKKIDLDYFSAEQLRITITFIDDSIKEHIFEKYDLMENLEKYVEKELMCFRKRKEKLKRIL